MQRDNTMEITFLGTGTIYPDPERRAPGLALRSGRDLVVFDSGPGTWFRLTEAGFDFRKVDAIVYSHLHLDHVLDYPAYLFLTHNPDFRRSGPLSVYAPREFGRFERAPRRLFKSWMKPHAVTVTLNLLPRKKTVFTIKGLTVTSAPVSHSETSLAFRVEKGGKSFVYGGDLEYCPRIVKLAEGADLLVTESAFPESDPRPGHLTPSLAGRIAREADVKKLALTHFYPACKKKNMTAPAKKEFSGEVIAAHDLMRITV